MYVWMHTMNAHFSFAACVICHPHHPMVAKECEVKVAESNGQTSDSFFYINGICTTRRMAIATGFELAKMFNKNVSVVHNPTDSVLVDLLEVRTKIRQPDAL